MNADRVALDQAGKTAFTVLQTRFSNPKSEGLCQCDPLAWVSLVLPNIDISVAVVYFFIGKSH